MVKTCHICGHSGELTWRDGKYYCAMCGTHIEETQYEPQPQHTAPAPTPVYDVECPICRNRSNNAYENGRYRCSLCGTRFDPNEPEQTPIYQATGYYPKTETYQVKELKKQKDKYVILGIVFICIFWPVGVYFLYKAYQTSKELKALGF